MLQRIALAAGLLLGGIQLWPAGRTNPPTTDGLEAPPAVTTVLRRACFDCHSNETRWPWYAYVAPISWWMVSDVDVARAELNFSHWGTLPAKKRERRADQMIDEIESDAMPPKSYRRLHADSQVTAEELDTLRTWAQAPH